MEMKESIFTCKFCGKKIGVITYGIYRKAVVDAEAVIVAPDPEGEDFVRIDGTKIRGVEVPFMPDGEGAGEPAYRLHRKTCGGKG